MDAFYEKFRIRKIIVEWKKELQSCKYIPGSNSLPMINRFQYICNKLTWPLAVQIEKFIRILPINLKQFVISRDHATFAAVKTYQEMIEVDTVSHVFKNVSFEDNDSEKYLFDHKSTNQIAKYSSK